MCQDQEFASLPLSTGSGDDGSVPTDPTSNVAVLWWAYHCHPLIHPKPIKAANKDAVPLPPSSRSNEEVVGEPLALLLLLVALFSLC